jgi:methionyl-tRNA formyltransferase
MAEERWRIVVVSTVLPVVEHLVPFVRDLGHDPVAVLSARPDDERVTDFRAEQFIGLVARTAPGLDVLFPASKHAIERLLRAYEPDLVLCWGYPWKIPAEALAVPRLGAINQHPALLPRHRGPVPLAWTLRSGDTEFGLTWHRMDAELDTGPILAQTTVPVLDEETTIEEIGPRLGAAALSLLPRVLERVAAGDPGEPQSEEGASWAGHFGEDYADVDLSRTAREVHNQVRAWRLTFELSNVVGPVVDLDGARVRLLRSSLVEHPDAVARLECADAPLWILAHEPAG